MGASSSHVVPFDGVGDEDGEGGADAAVATGLRTFDSTASETSLHYSRGRLRRASSGYIVPLGDTGHSLTAGKPARMTAAVAEGETSSLRDAAGSAGNWALMALLGQRSSTGIRVLVKGMAAAIAVQVLLWLLSIYAFPSNSCGCSSSCTTVQALLDALRFTMLLSPISIMVTWLMARLANKPFSWAAPQLPIAMIAMTLGSFLVVSRNPSAGFLVGIVLSLAISTVWLRLRGGSQLLSAFMVLLIDLICQSLWASLTLLVLPAARRRSQSLFSVLLLIHPITIGCFQYLLIRLLSVLKGVQLWSDELLQVATSRLTASLEAHRIAILLSIQSPAEMIASALLGTVLEICGRNMLPTHMWARWRNGEMRVPRYKMVFLGSRYLVEHAPLIVLLLTTLINGHPLVYNADTCSFSPTPSLMNVASRPWVVPFIFLSELLSDVGSYLLARRVGMAVITPSTQSFAVHFYTWLAVLWAAMSALATSQRLFEAM
eukprot:PLAT7446.1.p1 GENE.PLAT7446.1~~PLAT7446.1.p1  ORF type:complete len:489 (-),score=190.52 PLAT7446.1:1400-2866(-)